MSPDPARDGARADYVIIGAGSAGCVLAYRLARAGGARVAVLEAGGSYRRALDVPLLGLWLWRRWPRAFCWNDATTPQPHLYDRRLWWPAGRLVGGSSSINAMIYHRGHPASYDRWPALGAPGWGYADVLPYFRRAENYEGGSSPLRGVGGPLDVSSSRYRSPLGHAFVEGCAEVGIPPTADWNGTEPEGAGFFQVTQRRGRRASAATAYLLPALRSGQLRLLTGALVHRILFEGRRAAGVEYVQGDRSLTIRAEREVLLCAGTVRSAQLLLLSGIGPSDRLRRLGLPVVQDLPGVGSNLQDHVRVPLVYRSARRPDGVLRLLGEAARYVGGRRGLFASNVCDAGAVTRTAPGPGLPDVQLVLRWRAPGRHAWPAVDFEVCLIDPESRGHVAITSGNPLARPAIHPNYIGAGVDLDTLARGLELARAVATSTACQRAGIGEELIPGRGHEREQLEAHIRARAEVGFHPVGTCRIGMDAQAVVDPALRVRGVNGLRVADASVMPRIVTGNTNAAAIMIGERAADLVLDGE